MMITDTQTTSGYGARSRSRSRSTPAKRRSVARGRSQSAVSMVPRSLRYNGSCQLARSCIMPIPVTATSGFTIAGQAFNEAVFTYSPQYLRLVGDSTHSITALLPQYAELGAVWERVRIDRVELTIVANAIDEAFTVASGQPIIHNTPRIVIANDWCGPDNGGTSGTLGQVLQETNAKMFHIGGDHPPAKWSITKPKYNRLIQYTDTESDFEPANGFVNSRADIPHSGTRIGIPDIAAVGGCRILVFAKFFFTFKSVH